KTVFLTGHTGFKGSWLSFWLDRLGARVIGYSKDFPSKPSHFELLPRPENSRSYIEDITDLPTLQRVMEEHRPDIVFHLAAQSLVRYSYAHPTETFSSNMMGTANALECSRRVESVRAFVNVTSDKCYENKDDSTAFRETDRMGGYDPYSCSKGVSELLTSCYRNSFFGPAGKLLASGRAGNVIGGGDWALDRLIPDVVKATARGDVTIIRNPQATRPWQHVLEPLSGYLLLGQKLLEGDDDFADGWNFGPKDQEALTVLEVLQIFEKHWDEMLFEYDKNPNNPHEANFLSLDCTKSNGQLNWHPVWTSAEAIEKTVKWYRSYYTNGRITTLEDLVEYSNEAQQRGYSWAAPIKVKHEVHTD
ncbi:MAG: CDP-glucose 4,6-dehydratase, partial [Lewinella sp.]|nr:CDP-glucose 4,6-dehydratase [Lewinella sp.]